VYGVVFEKLNEKLLFNAGLVNVEGYSTDRKLNDVLEEKVVG
jgi:hypothetical protein